MVNHVSAKLINSLLPELRQNIYSYLLPHTISETRTTSGIVWLRGQTSLLRVNTQLHAECMHLLYNTSTFVIWITYNRVDFLFQWLIPSGLTPKLIFPFLESFRAPTISLMTRFIVNVEQVDSYMGMIKYNCGGAGLVARIREQVATFVRALRSPRLLGSLRICLAEENRVLTDLRRVKVHCVERDRNTAFTQTVLDPFKGLRAVGTVEILGAVEPSYALRLQDHIRGGHEPS